MNGNAQCAFIQNTDKSILRNKTKVELMYSDVSNCLRHCGFVENEWEKGKYSWVGYSIICFLTFKDQIELTFINQ